MDDSGFDRLTRALHQRLDRRRAAGALLGTPVAALGVTVAAPEADAKKKLKCPKSKKFPCGTRECCKRKSACCKKKCCKAGEQCYGRSVCSKPFPCPITATSTTWTLTGDCTITEAIQLPSRISLNGGGFTLSVSGNASQFGTVVLSPKTASPATLSNLTIDASGMTNCGSSGPSLVEWQEGRVENLTITNVVCDAYTIVAVLGRAQGNNLAITVPENSPTSVGVILAEGGSIANSTIQNAQTGIASDTPRGADITNNQVLGTIRGIQLVGAGRLSTVSGNTITGRGDIDPFPGPAAGVVMGAGAAATITANTVSNFYSSNTSSSFATGCGIRVEADAGAGSISDNIFPDPPGNEQDICDFRPQ